MAQAVWSCGLRRAVGLGATRDACIFEEMCRLCDNGGGKEGLKARRARQRAQDGARVDYCSSGDVTWSNRTVPRSEVRGSAIHTILYAHVMKTFHAMPGSSTTYIITLPSSLTHFLDLLLLHSSSRSSEDSSRFIQHGPSAISLSCVYSHAICPADTGMHNHHSTSSVR